MKTRGWVLAAAVILVAAVAAGATYLLAGRGRGEAEAQPQTRLVRVGEILTNLADSDRPRYIQVNVDLEVEGERAARALEERMPEVRDQLIALLRATRYAEVQGAEGMARLAERMVERLNQQLREGRVRRVFFTSFVVQ